MNFSDNATFFYTFCSVAAFQLTLDPQSPPVFDRVCPNDLETEQEEVTYYGRTNYWHDQGTEGRQLQGGSLPLEWDQRCVVLTNAKPSLAGWMYPTPAI